MTDPTGRGPTPDLDPGGINGDDYSRRVDAEIAWLARRVARRLTVTGTNALTGTTPTGDPAIAALATGMRISFVPVANNTTAVTLNPDGLGAISVVDADGTALASGQLRNGRPVEGTIYSDGKLRLTSGLSAPATPPKIAIITNSRTNAYGGSLSSGSNNTLALNTLLLDEIGITGSLPTFTIPAGTWDIDLVAAISDVDAVQLRLRNTTDSSDVTTVIGTAGRLPTANADHEVSLRGRITLASAKSFQVWARVSTTIANEAQGGAQESGDSWFTSNQLNYARLIITEARSYVAGTPGAAATIAVGAVTQVAHDDPPTVTNTGSSAAAVLDFEIPAGVPNTLTIGTVVDGLTADASITGTAPAQTLNLVLPAGDAATIEVGTVITAVPGAPVTVTNSGTSAAAVLDFEIPEGDPGADGTDPGVLLTFDDGTADADPGAGAIRADDVDLSAATTLFISKTNRAGNSIASWLLGLASSSSMPKGQLTLTRSGGNAQTLFDFTGITDATGYVKLSITNHSGATGFVDGNAISLQAAKNGDAGTVVGVAAGDGILVDSADPANPEVSVIFGTGAGSAAEGNDSRITGALQASALSTDGLSLVQAADYAAMRALLEIGKQIAVFTPQDNQPPTANFATLDIRNGRPVLDFDTTTQETAIFTGAIPAHYGTSGLTVTIEASLTSATSGTLGWVAAFERTTGLDIDSDSFATAKVGTAASVPGTSGQTLRHTISFTHSEIDGLVAGDIFRLRIRRDVANDTAAGDAELLLAKVDIT